MKDVLIRDILPPGLTYIQNSTEVYNANNPDGVFVSDNIVSNTGINIGDYTSGANAWIYFSVTVNEEANIGSIQRCIVEATGGYGTSEDSADVGVVQ